MTFWGTLGRIVLVPVAFFVSAVVTIFVLFSLGSERFTQMTHRFDDDLSTIPMLVGFVFDIHLLASGLTLLPALLLIIVGEVARIRSSLYYIIGGGIVLAMIPIVAKVGAGQDLQMPPTVVWQVLSTAGFAGGLVYWMIAGRSA